MNTDSKIKPHFMQEVNDQKIFEFKISASSSQKDSANDHTKAQIQL